jgi:hypothetical protein
MNYLRQETIKDFGTVYVYAIICPNCDGQKMIGNTLQHECQSCGPDGRVELVRYDAFKATISQLGRLRENGIVLDQDCTCGSGGHPRECKKHPLRFDRHVRELNEIGQLEDLIDLRNKIKALVDESIEEE